ncbi:MAG: tRNA (adenosine(37)-N6)-dimethylallyltransferase MiaA [Betaproteobacteria bacterium]
MSLKLPPVILIVGPTASGKTELAMNLVDRFPLEIVSVDSALVYRGMNIGTAKPTAETLQKYPHHLIDLIEPTDHYSAARFCGDALNAITDIGARGKIPLLVGGTMLYVKALLEGLSDLPEADTEVREALAERALLKGWPAMHAELARIDPETAARLKPTDAQRIQRALEVFQLTGSRISELQVRHAKQQQLPFEALKIGLTAEPRAILHERIAIRFDKMLSAGLIDEVVSLRQRYVLRADMPSMRCVGYRQAWQLLEGELDEAAMRERGVAATRQLAKRQLTWLRAMPEVQPIDCLRSDLADRVVDKVEEFLQQI